MNCAIRGALPEQGDCAEVEGKTTSGFWGTASRTIFLLIAAILLLLALVLAGNAVAEFTRAVWTKSDIGSAALDGIGYVIVAMATFEIAKYLIEEEVLRGRELRVTSEARRSLTHFFSTIAVAILLEALVTVFRVSKEDVSQLVYPTFLLIAGILIVLGLGLYQRLSASVEEQVEERDVAEMQNDGRD
jgi:hypothetical protein